MSSEIEVRINAEINRAYYTYDRYKADATFALVYHDKELGLEALGEYVRISDRFVKMDENNFFMLFHFTDANEASKASQNLLLKLDNHFHDTSTCIAIDTFNTSNSTKVVLNRLNQIIKETRKNSFTRIEYEDILDSII